MVQTLEFIRRAEISCNLLGQNQNCRHDQHSLLHFDHFFPNSLAKIQYNFSKKDKIKAKARIYELPHNKILILHTYVYVFVRTKKRRQKLKACE